MSLRSRWESKLKGSRAAGIEMVLQGGAFRISYVLLEKKGSKLDIASSGNIDEAGGIKLPAGTPVSVSISGKGIIHKKVSFTEDLDAEALLHKALPNAKINEFYIQQTQPVNGHMIVSAARRSIIDEVLAGLQKSKLNVVSCTLGPFCISSILSLMETGTLITGEVRVPGHTIIVEEGKPVNYATEENTGALPAEVGGEQISASILVAFAAAASYFMGQGLTVNISSISAQAGELRQKNIFRLASAGLLAFLFTLLLTNYLVFDHYWQKKQSYEAQNAGNQDALKKHAKLRSEYDEKMKFLESSGLLETSRSSFYADRIGIDLPSAIHLLEMNINPREKQPADEDALKFKAKEIHIQGNCRHSSELNEWIKLLKKKEWVSGVELLNYKQGKGDTYGTFSVGIKIK
jgi:hypothetical protein